MRENQRQNEAKKTSTPKKIKRRKNKTKQAYLLAKTTTTFFPFLYPCKNPLTQLIQTHCNQPSAIITSVNHPSNQNQLTIKTPPKPP
jgi:hypothetical protein